MSPERLEDLLERAKQVGLLSDAEVRSLTETISSSELCSQDEVAHKLVDSHVLTRYQADCLLTGVEKCVLAGRYQLLEKIGAGGMGSVFRAKDAKLSRTVAVKIMSPHHLSQRDAVARFQREAQALAQLDSPYIVQAFDAGEDEGRQFLVMEYVAGVSLNERVREKGKVAPTIAADYIYQAALGMQQAHGRGLIHRDLKPGNLLLTKDGQIKVLDLGLARFVQDLLPEGELTRENAALGTPDYMSPEQFSNAHAVDPRADVYSLGCTLYYLIAGRVPFPGSSLAEKAQAHQEREPQPLEEICPEIPAGLAMIVSKMMAKRPADRIQSMGEIGEALAPYVAGSSASLPSIRRTISWQGSQLTMAPRRQRPPWTWIGASGVGAAVLVLLAFWLPQWLGQPDTTTPPNTPIAKDNEPKVITIPDGLTVAQDGTGQFKTLNEALAKIEPGKTILVLDDAVYAEEIKIDDPERQRGIHLRAQNRAIIELSANAPQALMIDGVADVNVKGFRFTAKGAVREDLTPCVKISGKSPGVRLEDLDIATNERAAGIAVWNAPLTRQETPIVITDCKVKVGGYGILIIGAPGIPASQVVVHRNQITGRKGIYLELNVANIQITGNIIRDCEWVLMELQNLAKGVRDIVIANNTFFKGNVGLRVLDGFPHRCEFAQGQVRLHNNVFLRSDSADLCLLGPNSQNQIVGQDSAFLTGLWTFSHNWRDLAGDGVEKITPLAAKDHRLNGDEYISLSPGHADFLRPKKSSPLAMDGAGGGDPAFPAYVGAVPPEGVEAWNWKWTWDAYFHKTLTVSQDAKDEAQFKSINTALAKVKPGMTIRVLDKAEYKETIDINRPALHAGITIEASQKATLAPPGDRFGVFILNVPNVTVRGFRLRAETDNIYLATVAGRSAGSKFIDLEMEPKPGVDYVGVDVEQLTLTAADAPVLVQSCRIDRAGTAIRISGAGDDGTTPLPIERLLIIDNHITDAQIGVQATGALHDVLVAANRFLGCTTSAVQLVGLHKETKNLLIANNTMSECNRSLTLFDTSVKGKEVRISNNLVLSSPGADMVFVEGTPLEKQPTGPKDGNLVHKAWKLSHNWREVQKPTRSSVFEKSWIPPGPDDVRQDRIEGIGRTPGSPLFLRPSGDSPLAKEGAGKADSSLPAYVGAVPPEGIEPWDWNRTWQAWMKKK